MYLLCCNLLVEGNYIMWQINPYRRKTEKELEYVLSENQVIHTFAHRYPELGVKVCLSVCRLSEEGATPNDVKYVNYY